MLITLPSLRSVLVLGSIAVLAATFSMQSAKADIDIETTNLNLDIIMGTLTVQTPGGDVLDRFSDLYLSETIPADLASQIAADPLAPTYVQTNISLFVGETTFSYLDGSSFPQELLGVSGVLGTLTLPSSDEFSIVPDDLASISLGAITSNTGVVPLADNVFEVIGLSPDQTTEIDGFIDVNYYTASVVETVPEPSCLALVSLGVLVAFRFVRRKS